MDVDRAVIYRQILERVATLKAAPDVWDALSPDEQHAFDERLTDHELTWDEVSEADKALIRRGEFSVSAGKGRLTSPAELGDWQAIDRALDLDGDDDMVALDSALFAVGHGFPKEPWLGSGDADPSTVIMDPNITDTAGDAVDPDDVPEDGEVEGWVGV